MRCGEKTKSCMLISTDYLFSILFSMVIKRVACFVAADIPLGSEKGSSSCSASCKCRPCYSTSRGVMLRLRNHLEHRAISPPLPRNCESCTPQVLAFGWVSPREALTASPCVSLLKCPSKLWSDLLAVSTAASDPEGSGFWSVRSVCEGQTKHAFNRLFSIWLCSAKSETTARQSPRWYL